MSKKIKWTVGIVAAVIVVGGIAVYPKLVVTRPNDGADAKMVTFKDVRGLRLSRLRTNPASRIGSYVLFRGAITRLARGVYKKQAGMVVVLGQQAYRQPKWST